MARRSASNKPASNSPKRASGLAKSGSGSAKSASELLANFNRIVRERSNTLSSLFQSYRSPKHNHNHDYGYPDQIGFAELHYMFKRNGLARGAVMRTVEKTWENVPVFLQTPADEDETPQEKLLAETLKRVRFWQRVADTDRRSMVGRYSALILRIADNQKFDQPIDGKVTGGLESLIEVIPAWEGQLRVASYHDDQNDPLYGQPKMYEYSESAVSGSSNQPRKFLVHPDRVVIWSNSGTVFDDSELEAGYNALLDCEKIAGAGGEGFWKMAKAAPILEIDKDASTAEMAKTMGVSKEELMDAIGDQVEDYTTGLDKTLLLQGMKASTLAINMPSPEHAFAVSLNIFACSVSMPVKILIGMQTGERASSEDQTEWTKTIMSRREMRTMPLLQEFIDRLKRFAMIDDSDWFIDWVSLMEDSPDQQIERAGKMAEVNAKSPQQPVFLDDEIREAAGYDALTAADRAELEPEDDDFRDDPDLEDED